MGVLTIGYDIEGSRFEEAMPGVTAAFLEKVHEIHLELEAPCTLFVLGQTLKSDVDGFKKLRGYPEIFDIQQHTYSHITFKTLVETARGGQVKEGVSLECIRNEVEITNKLLKDLLGVECLGLTTPNGYYLGLSDRPDILEVLHDLGIRFIRSYGRNESNYQPVPFDVQPFWYGKQGSPDTLEIPMQGWQDWLWRESHGWEMMDKYLEHLKSEIDSNLATSDLVWSWVGHDVTCLRNDPEMSVARSFIEHARSRGVELLSCRELYERMKNGTQPKRIRSK